MDNEDERIAAEKAWGSRRFFRLSVPCGSFGLRYYMRLKRRGCGVVALLNCQQNNEPAIKEVNMTSESNRAVTVKTLFGLRIMFNKKDQPLSVIR